MFAVTDDSMSQELPTDPSADRGLKEPLIQTPPPALPQSPAPPEVRGRSRNIDLIMLYTLLIFAGRSMWSTAVLPSYIYLLRDGDTESVGLITCVMGVSQLLMSFPAGVLADVYRRDRVLRVSAIVGTAAVIATVLALRAGSFGLLAVALAVWGSFWGLAYTCVGALFADSIDDGERSYWFTRRSVVIKIGNMVGPIGALVMFAVLGDEWTVEECTFVMTCGQILCMPAILMLCFVSDDYSPQQNHYNQDQALDGQHIHNPEESSVPSSNLCFCVSTERFVPTMVATADVLAGIASGMSIRYFPIFFLDNMDLHPVSVQVLFLLSPALQIPLSILAQRGAKRFGRCQITIAMKWIGVVLFVSMILSYKAGLPGLITCALWLGRTSCINSTSALTKSIIMDSVPQSERGKWSALESLNMFGWSGSAFLGGILAGHEGIIFNFSVTSSLQLVATLPLIFVSNQVQNEAVNNEGDDGVEPGCYNEEGSTQDSVNDDTALRSIPP